MTRSEQNDHVFKAVERLRKACPEFWKPDNYDKLIRKVEGGGPDDIFLDAVQLARYCVARNVSLRWVLNGDGQSHEIYLDGGLHVSGAGPVTIDDVERIIAELEQQVAERRAELAEKLQRRLRGY